MQTRLSLLELNKLKMGNKLAAQFRGADDVALADIIKAISNEDYQTFLKQAEDALVLGDDPVKTYQDKIVLINDLKNYPADFKKEIADKFAAGAENPFV